jgi:hypothetical protein
VFLQNVCYDVVLFIILHLDLSDNIQYTLHRTSDPCSDRLRRCSICTR